MLTLMLMLMLNQRIKINCHPLNICELFHISLPKGGINMECNTEINMGIVINPIRTTLQYN